MYGPDTSSLSATIGSTLASELRWCLLGRRAALAAAAANAAPSPVNFLGTPCRNPPLCSENELIRELPSETGFDVEAEADTEPVKAAEGAPEILVIPRWEANPNALAGDELFADRADDPDDPMSERCDTTDGAGRGIGIGGVESDRRWCQTGSGGGSGSSSSSTGI